MERIGRVGIQNAQPSAVVVAEWSIGLLGRVPLMVSGAGANGNIMALHTAEWLKPRKCPSQNRFEIVGFRSCGHVFFSEKALEISSWQLC